MGLHAVENVAAASSRSRAGRGGIMPSPSAPVPDQRSPADAGGKGVHGEASPLVAHAERRCAGVCSLTRGNLAARNADCARLVDQSGKKGWQKLDGPQRGQVHPGLIWQDAVGARSSSRERTWPLAFLGCQRAAGPSHSQRRMDSKMGVKSPKKGQNCGFFGEKLHNWLWRNSFFVMRLR